MIFLDLLLQKAAISSKTLSEKKIAKSMILIPAKNKSLKGISLVNLY